MAQTTTSTWSKAFKILYKDLVRTWYEDNPTAAQMKKDTSYEGEKMVIPILTAGSMASTDFVTAMNNRIGLTPERFEIDVVPSYAMFSIKNLALKKAKSQKGSVARLLETVIDAAMYGWKRKLAAGVWGNGGGALGQIGALADSNTTVTLKDTSRIVFIEEKQVLQFSATDGTSGSVLPGRATVQTVDRDNGKFVVDINITTVTGATTDYYIFNDGDFGNGVKGIPAWCPLSAVEAATTFLTVNRAKDIARRAGSRFPANGDTIEHAMVDAVARHMRNGGSPNRFIVGPMRFAEFQKNAQSKNYPVEVVKTDKMDITFSGYALPTPKGKVIVMPDPDCPDDVGWLTKMEDWVLFSAGPCPHFEEQSGDKMLVEVADDAKGGRIISYYNIYNKNIVNTCAVGFA